MTRAHQARATTPQRRVEAAVETLLDTVASQPADAYRASLRAIAAALRVEADEIEALANDRTTK